jgi:hypothetical protein
MRGLQSLQAVVCFAFLALACGGSGNGNAGARGSGAAGTGGPGGASAGHTGSAARGGTVGSGGTAGASGGAAGAMGGATGDVTGTAGGGASSAAGAAGSAGASGGTAAAGRGGTGGGAGSAGGRGGSDQAGRGGGAARGGAGGGAGTPVGGSGGGAASGSGGASASRCNATPPAAGTFFVDAMAGRDTSDGATPATAWQTLTKVNATTFQPGNAICFKAGGAWTGSLAPKGSGSASAPIVVDQFGQSSNVAKPRIAAGASDLQALLLQSVQYWEVNNLELTNTKSAPGDYRGISVRGRDTGVLNHIYIRNCFVHDVSGVVNWIGGDTADNDPPWVTFQTGWDASKRTGGIVVEVESANGTRTWFNDVIIENNVIQDVSFGGVVFKQLDGGHGWGVRASKTDSKFTPHTNVTVRGNYVSQTNAQYGCNAFYITGVQHAVVERNVSKDAGTSAIEIYNSDDVKVQYNETFGTVQKAGGADSNGIDSDRASTATVIQYNYIHDNGDGILLCQFAFGDSIVRYNVLVNNKRYGINLHSDASATNQTYNNLIFIDGLASANLIATSGTASETLAAAYTIRNNILRSSRAAAMVVTGGGVTYGNNLFSGVTAVGSASQSGDPMFVNSATHPNGTMSGPALSQLTGFQVRTGSLAIDNGVAISGNGGVDFWGGPLYARTADIGPYEAP